MANKLKCPKCGSTHVDEFENQFWFLCRDCGYNSLAYSDKDKAVKAFCKGEEDE